MSVVRYATSSYTRLLQAICLIAAALGIAGCVSPRAHKYAAQAEPPPPIQSEARYRKEYVLCPGDQIEVLVRRVPEVSRAVIVRPDGMISLPMLDAVPAAGLTVSELDAKLTELFSARLVNPDVSIIVIQAQPAMVYVVGEVNNPSPVQLRNVRTAMQAIASTGGFRRSAATHNVAIIRLTEDGRLRAIPVQVASHGQPGPYLGLEQIQLRADDIVFVPESGRSQFTRFLEDLVNRPLMGVNSIMGAYINFKLVNIVNR